MQQVNNEVARIMVAYPVHPPAWVGREMWIGQTRIHNLVTRPNNDASPFTKYTGREIDFSSVCWAPVGQLVVVRRTVNDMKARDADALDGMIGKPRGQLAILLGIAFKIRPAGGCYQYAMI